MAANTVFCIRCFLTFTDGTGAVLFNWVKQAGLLVLLCEVMSLLSSPPRISLFAVS